MSPVFWCTASRQWQWTYSSSAGAGAWVAPECMWREDAHTPHCAEAEEWATGPSQCTCLAETDSPSSPWKVKTKANGFNFSSLSLFPKTQALVRWVAMRRCRHIWSTDKHHSHHLAGSSWNPLTPQGEQCILFPWPIGSRAPRSQGWDDHCCFRWVKTEHWQSYDLFAQVLSTLNAGHFFDSVEK